MPKDFTKEIYAYALVNALDYGEARTKAILPKLFLHGLKKTQIKNTLPLIEEIVNLVNAMPDDVRKDKFGDYNKYVKERDKEPEKVLRDLPNISKHMVFRMAPFPSGTLHIGNMKTYLLNALYAEKYKAKIRLVIDDTIGSDDKGIDIEAYRLIPEAFNALGVKYKKPIVYKSDRLKIYYKYAEQIIRKKKAYVCSCSQDIIRENRKNQKTCGCIKYDVSDQIKRWKEMFKAPVGSYVLRINVGLDHPNPAFRDRVLFRISDKVHARVGKKYRVWPLLEFSWAIDDHLLRITHVIRGKELMMEGEMQKLIWKIFGWKKTPELIYVGLVKLDGIAGKLSKSKSQKEVRSGHYSGWDDPRTWSVQSLLRRGIKKESLREFVEKIGMNQKEITVPIDDLYAINRRKIDREAHRYSFVEDPVKISVNDNIKKSVNVKMHPEKTSKKKVSIGSHIYVSNKDYHDFKKKEVRLMHLFNIKLDKKSKITSVENSQKIKKINWVSDGIKVNIMMVNGTWAKGLAEKSVLKLKKGTMIQFERFGFCRYDGKNRFTGEMEFWYTHD